MARLKYSLSWVFLLFAHSVEGYDVIFPRKLNYFPYNFSSRQHLFFQVQHSGVSNSFSKQNIIYKNYPHYFNERNIPDSVGLVKRYCQTDSLPDEKFESKGDIWDWNWKRAGSSLILSFFVALSLGGVALADDELAKFAAEGHEVGVEPACFMKNCKLETTKCINNPNCMKGLACLAKCKGDSMCSTGCFSKFGNPDLDSILYCSVEKEDCVKVPRDESRATWEENDKYAPPILVKNFQPSSLEGTWYKVLGLDTRYDCFDCQMNQFTKKPSTNKDKKDVYEAMIKFRMPRQRAPGYYENNLKEDIIMDPPGSQRSMHTVGRMFGLTFWENWYVIGESSGSVSPFKFIYYTGHTLQGNYKGAFVYARTPHVTDDIIPEVSKIADQAGLDFSSFCQIRNSCFEEEETTSLTQKLLSNSGKKQRRGFWFLGTEFLAQTKSVAEELSDWFEDPTYLSEWLLDQQEKMIFNQPLEVSPFANLLDDEDDISNINKFLFGKKPAAPLPSSEVKVFTDME